MEWMQIFLILFFVLLVLLAIFLLQIQSGKHEDKRPQLDEDLHQQYQDTLLISILRTPTKEGTLADTIILGKATKETLTAAIASIPGTTELTITTPENEVITTATKSNVGQRSTAYLPSAGGNVKVEFLIEYAALAELVAKSQQRDQGGLG
jgi:anionic cell wall polymer biosynthesis LytR-Cps2A-Psr (LCP) family protein